LKKNAEGHFMLQKTKCGTPIAVSSAIYFKLLHQYQVIVGEKTSQTAQLAAGDPLPAIAMPNAPLNTNDAVANQAYYADRKEAKVKIEKQKEDLSIMRNKIVATTDAEWLRWQISANVTKAHYNDLKIIGKA